MHGQRDPSRSRQAITREKPYNMFILGFWYQSRACLSRQGPAARVQIFLKLLRVPTPTDRGAGSALAAGTPVPAPADPDTPTADIRIGYAGAPASLRNSRHSWTRSLPRTSPGRASGAGRSRTSVDRGVGRRQAAGRGQQGPGRVGTVDQPQPRREDLAGQRGTRGAGVWASGCGLLRHADFLPQEIQNFRLPSGTELNEQIALLVLWTGSGTLPERISSAS